MHGFWEEGLTHVREVVLTWFLGIRMTIDSAVQDVAAPPPEAKDVPRVLVVDDDENIRRLFRTILSAAIPGGEIDIVTNGAEAVESFEQKHHTLVLMDLHMPVMDGQAAFFEIEKRCRQADYEMPSVVFCTGFAPPESVIRTVTDNPKHCLLSKPVDAPTLIDAIKSRLR